MKKVMMLLEHTCSACAFHGSQADCEVCFGEVRYTEAHEVPRGVVAQILSAGAEWLPRVFPPVAKDGDRFWVMSEKGVVLAVWNAYPQLGVFQSTAGDDEGMCGFTVTHYQPIVKPDAP